MRAEGIDNPAGNIVHSRYWPALHDDPGVRGHFEHNTMSVEKPGRSTGRPPRVAAAALKPNPQKRTRDPWKSEVPIVAAKPGNAGGVKGDRFREAERGTMLWTQSQAHIMTPDAFRLATKARADLKMRCNSLMGMLHCTEGLRARFERLAKNKAPGVDGIRKENYAVGLET